MKQLAIRGDTYFRLVKVKPDFQTGPMSWGVGGVNRGTQAPFENQATKSILH